MTVKGLSALVKPIDGIRFLEQNRIMDTLHRIMARADKLREQRKRKILALLGRGLSLRQIAKEVGLSHARVAQILERNGRQ